MEGCIALIVGFRLGEEAIDDRIHFCMFARSDVFLKLRRCTFLTYYIALPFHSI
nr:hypothetical protein Q903MT_gene6088 [Picea sitchensis]